MIGLLGVNIPIVLGGALLMALGVVLIVIMPETGFKPTPRENRNTFQSMAHTFKSGLRVVRGKPALINILTIGLILGLYSEGFDRLWTPHLLNDITLPADRRLAAGGVVRRHPRDRHAAGHRHHRSRAAAHRYEQTRAGGARRADSDHRDGGGVAGVCADGQLRRRA